MYQLLKIGSFKILKSDPQKFTKITLNVPLQTFWTLVLYLLLFFDIVSVSIFESYTSFTKMRYESHMELNTRSSQGFGASVSKTKVTDHVFRGSRS